MKIDINLLKDLGDTKNVITRDAHKPVKDLNTIQCHTDGTYMPGDTSTQS